MPRLRILLVSTPVGPLGSGSGGGVELTLHSLVLGLSELGHFVEVVAPEGSLLVGTRVHQIPGVLQPTIHTAERDARVEITADPVLGAMWNWVGDNQQRFDVVINMAYDWLPMYLTPFLDVPVGHLISMASISEAMDDAIARVVAARPHAAAVHSQAQAASFGSLAPHFAVVGSGIALDRYDVHITADQPAYLGFVGRISPEKGIGDVFAIADRTGLPVKVWGLMQDPACWADAQAAFPAARVSYEGFLPTDELQAAIGGCSALLMTSKWVEAFGNVAIEAMACGVPVISYRRGGPAEIVEDGVTGYLVEPDSVDGMVQAVGALGNLDRVACRQRVEELYSTTAFATRVVGWLDDVVRCFEQARAAR